MEHKTIIEITNNSVSIDNNMSDYLQFNNKQIKEDKTYLVAQIILNDISKLMCKSIKELHEININITNQRQ